MNREDFRKKSLEVYSSLRRQALQEASILNPQLSNAAAGGASGSGSTKRKPTAEQIMGQTVGVWFYDPEKTNYQIITADFVSGVITDTIDTGVSNTAELFYNFTTQDGANFFFGDDSGNMFFSLYDGGGNQMITQILNENEALNDNWNVYEGEGGVISWYYSVGDQDNMMYKWYSNGVLNETRFSSVNGGWESLNIGWFGDYDETADGSHTVYYSNPDTGRDQIYLLRATGNVRDITSTVFADGRTPHGSLMELGNNTMALWYYNGTVYDKVRMLKTDGSYKDIDLTPYFANNVNIYSTNFGYVIQCTPDDQSKDLIFCFYDEADDAFSIKNAGPYLEWANISVWANSSHDAFSYEFSPEGLTNAYIILTGAGTFDDKMYRYDSIMIISKFGGYPIQTWINSTPSFGLCASEGKAAYPIMFAHTDGNANLQLLTFDETGYSLDDTESGYQWVTDYFQIIGMGIYTMLQWYDTGHSANQEQAFIIMNGNSIVDVLWTSTANSWGTNYDVAYVQQGDEDRFYYFTPTQESWEHVGGVPAGTTPSNDSSGTGDFGYIDGHNFGTYLIQWVTGEYGVLTRETNANLGKYTPQPSADDVYCSNNHIIFRQIENIEGSNVYSFYIVDTEGQVIQSVFTSNATAGDNYIISKRWFFAQNDGPFTNIYLITPGAGDTKAILADGYSTWVNDILWRNW